MEKIYGKKTPLKNNFLNQVIFRIDFSTILKISGNNKESAENFRESIFEEFPNVQIVPQNKINLDIDINSGQPKKLTKEGNLSWIFRNEPHTKEVSLTANDLVLNHKRNAYLDFDSFLKDVSLLINALKLYEPIKLKFLGLRYINQINNPIITKNITKYIDKSISHNFITDNLNENEEFVQIMSKLNIKHNNYLLTFQYGFFNPNFPNVNDKNEFILDYDCVNNNINSLDEINSNLTNMHKLIEEKFKVSATKQFKEFIDK